MPSARISVQFCCLLLLGISTSFQSFGQSAMHMLMLNDLGAWKAPHGTWHIVGNTTLDPADDTKLIGKHGGGVVLNGPTGRTENLISKTEHGDIEVHIEFMVPKGSNSGVYLQGRYEIQVLDSWGVKTLAHSDCGGIYQRYHEGPEFQGEERGYEGRPPRENASKKPGQWQSFDITFQAPRFDDQGNKTQNAKFLKVLHNGILIHENEELTGPTRAAKWQDEKPRGPLMLQGDHGPVAYRNIRIKPLD